MGVVLAALSLLAATAGVPWLHGADWTHVHHAAATDACPKHGHCHTHDDGVADEDLTDARDEGHRHDGHGEHEDPPPEHGPVERDGSCVTCVHLHLLTCSPPAADVDRAPTHSFAAWTRVTAGVPVPPAWRRVLPPGRGPPDERVS